MQFMKTGLTFCIFATLMVAASNAQVLIEDLQGEYAGEIVFPTIVAFNTEGAVTNYCLDEFSSECLEEVGRPVERVVINGTTISFTLVQAVGITSIELSAEAYPSCAAQGFFPVQNIQPLPPAEIQSYDFTSGHLTFIDPRRPNDTNCAIINVEEGKTGEKTLSAKYILVADSLPESQVVEFGPSFRCLVYNGLCISDTSAEGNFIAFVDVDFEIPCVDGPCEHH
eukprot:g2587.t1